MCIHVYKLLAKDKISFIVDLVAIINKLPINYLLGHDIWLTHSLMMYFHIHRGVQLYILTFINYLLNLTFINTHLLVIKYY